MKVQTSAAVAILLVSTLAGCLGAATPQSASTKTNPSNEAPQAPSAPKTVQVSLMGLAFVNKSVTLFVGDKIVWTHRDDSLTTHTVTADSSAPEQFDSHPACAGAMIGPPTSAICMMSGDTYAHVFAKEGAFGIHCKIHGGDRGSGMSMTVTVKPRAMAAVG